MALNNLKISTRLFLLTGTALLILVGSGVFGFVVMTRINAMSLDKERRRRHTRQVARQS